MIEMSHPQDICYVLTVYLKLLRVSRNKQAVGCHILLLSVVDTDPVPGVQGRGGGGWRRVGEAECLAGRRCHWWRGQGREGKSIRLKSKWVATGRGDRRTSWMGAFLIR